jgi:O-acetyl-ADP-ribose deacetylase (regulator of RNase III)
MLTIDIRKGDITKIEADAIVNAANNHLWMGGGVAGALKRTGGQEIETEAVNKGPIPIGEAVHTKAGRLKAKYIIHAAVMGQDLQTDGDKIQQATRNSLRRADELGIKSIAFPALGTGVGGFPLDEAARIMLSETIKYASARAVLETVIFVLYDEPAYRAFREEKERLDR